MIRIVQTLAEYVSQSSESGQSTTTDNEFIAGLPRDNLQMLVTSSAQLSTPSTSIMLTRPASNSTKKHANDYANQQVEVESVRQQ